MTIANTERRESENTPAAATPNERCPFCGGTAVPVREVTDVAIGKRKVRVAVDRFRCDECGERFYSPEQMDRAQIAASDEVRREDKLLLPAQIRQIRSKYGFTQAQFERLLGVGPKTVIRWERGTVFQNRSTDALLRVLDALPDAVAYLAKANGVGWSAAKLFHGSSLAQKQNMCVRFGSSVSGNKRIYRTYFYSSRTGSGKRVNLEEGKPEAESPVSDLEAAAV
jgi:HTH-type transcriptional regulator / antitoxin MqsA